MAARTESVYATALRDFLPHDTNATHMHSAVYVAAHCLSVRHKLVYYRNGCMGWAGSRHWGYTLRLIYCVLTE